MRELTYQEQVKQTLDRYKRKNPEDYLVLIPIFDKMQNTIGFLRPVTADYRTTTPACVELFSRWREENPTLSLARFQVTNERTERWLDRLVVENDNRIIFLIQDSAGEYIGHIGFAGFRYEKRAAEVDSVLRGKKGVHPRMMEWAMDALICWGKRELGLEHIDLEVYSANEHAIQFYKRCGFCEGHLIPLRRVELSDEVKWVPCDDEHSAEKYYLHMVLC